MEKTKKEILCLLEYITGMKAEDIDVTKPFNYYGCDSLDILDIVIKCENAYGLKIKDDVCKPDDTIESYIQIIDKQLQDNNV